MLLIIKYQDILYQIYILIKLLFCYSCDFWCSVLGKNMGVGVEYDMIYV